MCATTSGGSRFAAGLLPDQRLDLRPLQAVQGERRHVRARCPGRHKLWTEGQHRQYRTRRDLVDEEAEALERRGIRPVQVLPDDEHRLPLGVCPEPRQEGVVRVLPLLLGRQGEGGIGALGHRHGQQRGKQRHDLLQGQGIRREQPFELGEPGGWGIIPRKLEQPFQVPNNRREGTVRVIG